MAGTDRELIIKWWDEAWSDGVWAGAWGKSLDGLTPAQAAWQPPSAPGVQGDRHSIWQIVLHIIFWRENWLGRLAGGKPPTDEELAHRNFPVITDRSGTAWAEAKRRFEVTQAQIGAALRDPRREHDPIMHFLPHDCYHFGQINYLRAMQGLKPIE